jgi:phosphatidyl-myo-inositol dimannoside synthase
MQNVSLQMIEAVKCRNDIVLETIIMHSSWRFIGIKSFFFLVALLWRIPFGIRRFKPDVVLFSSMVTAGVLPFLIWKLPVPCVAINHGQDVTLPVRIYQWYLPKVFKKLEGVISVSSATREASIQRGMRSDIGVALPNGFNVKGIRKLPTRVEALKILENELGLYTGDSKILLTVGRQVKRKGHQWFIENVFDRVEADVIYLIVGDGPEYKNIANAREKSSRQDRIIMTGKLSSEILSACYAAADLFIMPNIPVEGDMEGFGIVLLEANSAGVPAIATDLEGIKDVIKDGINGYRVPAGNAELFAKKIGDVLQNGLHQLSESSRNYVFNTFNWDKVIERYIDFLKRVIRN